MRKTSASVHCSGALSHGTFAGTAAVIPARATAVTAIKSKNGIRRFAVAGDPRYWIARFYCDWMQPIAKEMLRSAPNDLLACLRRLPAPPLLL